MCTQQTMVLADGTTVDGGYIDCMQSTCNNSIRYNPPPDPDDNDDD